MPSAAPRRLAGKPLIAPASAAGLTKPAPSPCTTREAISIPIVGATAEHHLDDAIAALEIELSTSERAELERPYLPRLTTEYT